MSSAATRGWASPARALASASPLEKVPAPQQCGAEWCRVPSQATGCENNAITSRSPIPKHWFFSVSISRLLNFAFNEGDTGKRCPRLRLSARCCWPTGCTWPRHKACGVSCRAYIHCLLLSERDKPQCEHKALNISVVGMRCLCQNPEFLIAGFESRICLNNAIKLYFKPAF